MSSTTYPSATAAGADGAMGLVLDPYREVPIAFADSGKNAEESTPATHRLTLLLPALPRGGRET
jgi:hypothetical protein